MTRLIIIAAIAAVAFALLWRWCLRSDHLPSDDAPAIVYAETYYGEPWGSYYERSMA